MNSFFLLILAHLLADFPFQPGILARHKLNHFSGVVLHGVIHFATSALLLFPFWNNSKIWIGIGIIFAWHVLVDQSKIMLNRKSSTNRALIFLLDQLLHLGMIALVSFYWIGPLQGSYPIDQEILWYVLILTLCTYTYDIVRWTLSRNTQPYARDYKMMFRNFVIVTIAFGIYFFTSR